MPMFYLVYLPALKIIVASSAREDCKKAFDDIGRDYDEDYCVMSDTEFLQHIKGLL